MKFTLSWLKEHLETTATLDEIIKGLVDIGLEVEGVDNPAEKYAGFCVAQIQSFEKHPDADRLNVCQVNDGGNSPLTIVCGAPNVRENMFVALAKPGVTIPTTGDVLKKGKIRGIESQGMMCSAQELDLGEDHDGIIDLETFGANQLQPGGDLAEALSETDVVIDISITPNRGDCFGVRGIARDLAAFGIGKLKQVLANNISEAHSYTKDVQILDDRACAYFATRLIKNIKQSKSPAWLEKRLKAIGVKCISAPVDITNYLAYDLGRPMHAFDADKIDGILRVRRAQIGEKIIGLDENEYSLDSEITIVTDNANILGVAGIMGGLASGCTDETTNIVLESAYFDPIAIAKAGQKLNIHTDSRTRFERGVDPDFVDYALNKATNMLVELCGGEIGPKYSAGKLPLNKHDINLTLAKLNSVSGYTFSMRLAEGYLNRLGCKTIDVTDKYISVKTPSHRHDLRIPEDLIEEIIRMHGYDNIPSQPLPNILPKRTTTPTQVARKALAQQGLNETVTFSMLPENIAKHFNENIIHIKHALNIDFKCLRPSIIPSLVLAAVNNHKKGLKNFKAFEVSPVFYQLSAGMNHQTTHITGVRFQKNHDRHWASESRDCDVYDIKADALAVLEKLGLNSNSIQIDTNVPHYFNPHRSGRLKLGNKTLGYFGNLHPLTLKLLKAKGACVAFEIDISQLPPVNGAKKPKPVTFSDLQGIHKDMAFIVDQSVTAAELLKAVQKADNKLLTSVNIFDVYQGNQGDKLAENQKSLAVEFTLQPQKKNLTDDDIHNVMNNITESVKKLCNGVLRDH